MQAHVAGLQLRGVNGPFYLGRDAVTPAEAARDRWGENNHPEPYRPAKVSIALLLCAVCGGRGCAWLLAPFLALGVMSSAGAAAQFAPRGRGPPQEF